MINEQKHPLLSEVAAEAAWGGQDQFPAHPEWADEFEKHLEWLKKNGQLESYKPRLRGPKETRDETFAEVSGGYFLQVKCGLAVVDWQPLGASGKRGDFRVRLPDGRDLFVEVKAPGWESEIAKLEGQNSDRLKSSKYDNAGGGATAPWWSVRKAIEKAREQMPDDGPTLVILVDDLVIPLTRLPTEVFEQALYAPQGRGIHTGEFDSLREDGCFASSACEKVGAVGILNLSLPCDANAVKYDFKVFHNPKSLQQFRVPASVFSQWPQFDGVGLRSISLRQSPNT